MTNKHIDKITLSDADCEKLLRAICAPKGTRWVNGKPVYPKSQPRLRGGGQV